ncbi:MAG TPA: hypothetical protein VFQ68_31410 [Streptosporangiaceae bacterium]|nr:hypothetical protein [Streptosporangiaceae bacterium]
MTILPDILLTPENKPHVIDDCLTLIDQEVKGKSGVSGTAVKLAYKTANAFASGYLRGMVELLAPDMIIELEPFWADFTASGAGDFGDYLVKHGDEVSEALLSVTDRRAETSTRPTILRAYKTVRGGASKHVTAALPALGALVQKYAG